MSARPSVEPMRGQSSLVEQPVQTLEGDHNPPKTYHVRRQPSDIDASVSFSFIRFVISIVSIGLVLTDIPRTGLYIDLQKYYPKVGVDTTMYYGPYAYSNAHLNRTNINDTLSPVSGYVDDTPIEGVSLWSYKFDTLSIPTRALAEHLNVSSYPPCVLYRCECPYSILDPEAVFNMLNDLITSIDSRYFAHEKHRNLPTVFYTTSNWADRLHHVLLGKLSYRIDVRIHAVYRFVIKSGASGGINVCEQHSAAESHHPLLCKSSVKWLCDHPFLGASVQISVADSIKLRATALQELYPGTELDITMITTHYEQESQRNTFFPTVFYYADSTEITTFIRGRDCRLGLPCTTLFLDDYRYERAWIETSSDSFQTFTSVLRALSQMYVWLRFVLLLYISCRTRLAEPKYHKKALIVQIGAVMKTIAKIPSHSIVYTSWLPLIGYSIAHFADCGLIHQIGENFWSTPNGLFSFNFMNYIEVTSIEMRSIWIIALVWKCGITVYNRFFTTLKGYFWQPRDGLYVFRGLFINLTSGLAIFAWLRALRFRNTQVLSFKDVQVNRGAMNNFLIQRLHKGSPDYGYPLDIKVTIMATAIVVGFVHFLRSATRMPQKVETRSFFCHTFYVPLSTGVLFPTSALVPFWYLKLARVHESQHTLVGSQALPSVDNIRVMSSQILKAVLPFKRGPRQQYCDTCDFVPSLLHWRAIQGCQRHETLFDIGQRSIETQSMVRLTHIGAFSDPIVFFELRVLGRQLNVYRLRENHPSLDTVDERGISSSGTTEDSNWRVFLSPVRLQRDSNWGEASHSTVEYDLVARVNSKCVPWTHLVDCG